MAGDERPFAVPRPYGRSVSQVQTTVSCASPSNICRVHHKSLPDLHTSPNRTSGSSSSSTNDSRYCEFVLGAVGAGADFSKFQGLIRIQNASNDKVSVPKTQKISRVELECVHAPPILLNFKNFFSQNKSNHTQLDNLHCQPKMQSLEASWETVIIQQIIFWGLNEYLQMLIKNNYGEIVKK